MKRILCDIIQATYRWTPIICRVFWYSRRRFSQKGRSTVDWACWRHKTTAHRGPALKSCIGTRTCSGRPCLNSLVVELFDLYSVTVKFQLAKCKAFTNLPNHLLKSCNESWATPLNLLFSFIFTTQHFPLVDNCLSLPLHKKISCCYVLNYRPVAVLPSLSKVFEKRANSHLYSCLESSKS